MFSIVLINRGNFRLEGVTAEKKLDGISFQINEIIALFLNQ